MEQVRIFNHYLLGSDGSLYSEITKKFLKLTFNEYSQAVKVQLSDNGVKKYFWLHNLVASYFIPGYNPKNDLVSFKDGDRSNCSIDNLVVNSNSRMTDIPDAAANKFFEDHSPYGLIIGYMKRRRLTGDYYMYSSSFMFEDLVQHLITLLHRRTPYYLAHLQHKQSYCNYAYGLFDQQFKSGDIYNLFEQFKGVIYIDNSFDYEIEGAFGCSSISHAEYLHEAYGRNDSGSHRYITNKR